MLRIGGAAGFSWQRYALKTRYTDIANLNPRLIKDPDLILPGQRFVLPDGAHDHGARRHATAGR